MKLNVKGCNWKKSIKKIKNKINSNKKIKTKSDILKIIKRWWN